MLYLNDLKNVDKIFVYTITSIGQSISLFRVQIRNLNQKCTSQLNEECALDLDLTTTRVIHESDQRCQRIWFRYTLDIFANIRGYSNIKSNNFADIHGYRSSDIINIIFYHDILHLCRSRNSVMFLGGPYYGIAARDDTKLSYTPSVIRFTTLIPIRGTDQC